MKNQGFKTCMLITSILIAQFTRAFGFGPEGHRIVGAIADALIADKPAMSHVQKLLDGKSLSAVANWADDAKYNPNPNDPDMVAFIAANPHHANYHYTDIPIQEDHYYNDSFGATTTDVVHMIQNCILILEKHDTPGTNPTGITQRMALRLLVHYVGDVHQPLHVGAAYFGPAAQLVNPNSGANAQSDLGGNAIKFRQGVKQHQIKPAGDKSLHMYWDNDVVDNALDAVGVTTEEGFVQHFVHQPPSNWQDGSSTDQWAVAWATEVLPIATEAHNKLKIAEYSVPSGRREMPANTSIFKWSATERQGLSPEQYDQWAAGRVAEELSKAGYRLAALLEQIWSD
jgi:hypothetical protein